MKSSTYSIFCRILFDDDADDDDDDDRGRGARARARAWFFKLYPLAGMLTKQMQVTKI